MKKSISIILVLLMLAACLASCATDSTKASSRVTLASSDAADCAEWLETRLGDSLPQTVVGVGSNDEYGVDLSDFENDGYILRSLEGEALVFGKTQDGLDRAVRAYAKAVEAGGAQSLDVTYHEGARIKKLTIGGADISEFEISYGDGASGNIVSAATEMSRLIEIATGVKLSSAVDSAKEHVIRFEASENEALGDYGYEYEVKDGSLYLRGAGKYGATNAVRRFCENELDWRGLIFGEAELTGANALEVADGTKKSEKPAFDYLYMYYNAWGKYDNPVQPSNLYGDITCACHGMQGNRFADCAMQQICYTSEYNYDEVYENVCNYLNGLLDSGYVVGENLLAIDIAQGDNASYCQCKNCRKVFAEEGGNAGAVVRFANRLAKQINEEDYDFDAPLYFKIFAYAGTNVPPKVTKPNEYIYVTFCTDMNCSNHLLDGSECEGTTDMGRNNKIYAEWLKGWCAICDNMYVWDYALDTVLSQYTVIDTMYEDFKFLADLKVKGVFWQCQVHGLGIQRVEHQLLAELNWNMEMTEDDFEAYLCDILRREYGDGWKYIRDYIDIWNAAQDAVGCWDCWGWTYHMFCRDRRFEEHSLAYHFDENWMLFESAIAAANDRAEEIRLKQLSCHMIYEGCYCSYRLALDAGDEARLAELSHRYDVMVERLAECGFDIDCIYTVDGSHTGFEKTIVEEFENFWAGSKDDMNPGHGLDPWYKAYFAQYGGK